jgi:RNA polymerase sigma factor (sigma-70 family)
MTVNQAHDYLRSWRYKKEMLLEGLHIKRNNAAPSIEQQFQATLEKSELISKLISLPVQYREILYLYYFEDFKMREIAELLKMTEGNVRTRLSRARAQLKAVYTFSEEEVLTNG